MTTADSPQETMAVPKVSVVMSVFNGERFLREAVESILNQSFREFEFIVIDDGSTDGSPSMLDSYQARDARVRIYHQENRGLIDSLNRGCSLAQGKYIARMDADDVCLPNRLLWEVDFIEQHPEVGVVGGAVELINTVGKPLGVARHPLSDGELQSELLTHCVLLHPTVLMRRDAFVHVGGYRGRFAAAEDYDLWLRIAEHFKIANLEQVVLRYRFHPFQVSLRKRRQQTLSILGAQLSASSRRKGLADPLNSGAEITPELLVALGVTKAQQQLQFASDSRKWIRFMCMAGEYSSALQAALETLQSDLKYVERWRVADLHLAAARLCWRQGLRVSAIRSVAQAVITYPVMVGRPLKPLLKRLGLVRFGPGRRSLVGENK